MASVPAPLKAVDIGRFALRATQLEKIKPQISYWLTLYIVEIILKNSLEKTSEECMLYTANLMDKLEGWKTEHVSDQTIHDDVAAQAFVEQFALSTFERADKAMRSRKTTYQTADTFQAARTFLDLLSIWQKPLNAEIATKSKYAKYHALRILKAIKAGEDPNLPEEELPELEPNQAPALDPSDPEVQNIMSMQPTVEDTDEQASSHLASAPVNPGMSISPSHSAAQDVSPLEPEQKTSYFADASPQIPTFTADDSAPTLPTASASDPMDISNHTTTGVSPVSPQDYYAQQPQQPPPYNQEPDPTSLIPPSVPQDPPTPALNHASARTISQFQTPPPPPAGAPTFAPQPPTIPPALPNNPTQQPFWSNHNRDGDTSMTNGPALHPQPYRTDDEAILNAQKHGKWALSALNFDDVETAVKEFKIALRHLGAL